MVWTLGRLMAPDNTSTRAPPSWSWRGEPRRAGPLAPLPSRESVSLSERGDRNARLRPKSSPGFPEARSFDNAIRAMCPCAEPLAAGLRSSPSQARAPFPALRPQRGNAGQESERPEIRRRHSGACRARLLRSMHAWGGAASLRNAAARWEARTRHRDSETRRARSSARRAEQNPAGARTERRR